MPLGKPWPNRRGAARARGVITSELVKVRLGHDRFHPLKSDIRQPKKGLDVADRITEGIVTRRAETSARGAQQLKPGPLCGRAVQRTIEF